LGRVESLPFHALAVLDIDRVGGDWTSALPLTREVWVGDRSVGRQTLAWTTGNLLPQLGIPIVGRNLSMRSVGIDLQGRADSEIVLARATARAWFGSEAAAIGRKIRWQSIGDVRPGADGTVEFLVVGVALSEFDGPVPNRPVAGWVPLGAWPFAIAPEGMQDVIAPLRPQFIGLQAREDFIGSAAAVNQWLQRSGRFASMRVALLPGIGETPQRRLVYQAWGDILLLNAFAMAVVLVATYVAARFVWLLRQRAGDAVRMAIGESSNRWWIRRGFAEILAAMGMIAVTVAAIAIAGLVPSRATELPINESLSELPRSVGAVVPWLVVTITLAPLLMQRWVTGQPTLGAAKSAIAKLKFGAVALIAVSACAVVIVAGTAALGVQRAMEFSRRDLGFRVDGLYYSPVVRSGDQGIGAPSILDGRSVTALNSEASMGDSHGALAAATAAPVGIPNVVSATIHSGGVSRSELIEINFVTASYYELVGVPIVSWCGSVSTLGKHQALANKVFLRRYGLPARPSVARIRASVPSAGPDFPDIEICGVVDDAQYADARGTATPTIYLPLQQASGLGVVLWRDPGAAELSSVRLILASVLPGTTLGPPRRIADRIADDLRLEVAIAALSILIMVMVALVAVAMCVSTLLATLEWMRPELAVRWAFGAGPWALALSLVRTKALSAGLFTIVLLIASLIAVSLLNPSVQSDALPLAWMIGLAAGAACVAAGLTVVRFRINDRMLARALGESERL